MKMQNATNCKTEESNHTWIPEDFLVMLNDHTEQWSILPDLPTLSKIKKRKRYFPNAINNLANQNHYTLMTVISYVCDVRGLTGA